MFKKKKNRVPVEGTGVELEMSAVNDGGEQVDTAVLQETGIAFDPTQMHLEMTKAEKRRTTALVLAIQAYDKLIIKDADYLREAHAQARSDGSVIRPATMDAMVLAALQFDAFISGEIGIQRTGISRESQSGLPVPDEPTPATDAVGLSVDEPVADPAR